ncbi:DNA N-6-adenine-methyltransferase [Novacetimonas hansenii]|uniref:N-6-adenine-methyltransferase n=2 Tax=Novacetimonas hansenii TaxID=436 RepID=A0ABQ0SFZ2_NOVHA|nr:hypothetical protein Gaha_0105_076 [Novacetimonas hansenii JCM 7643]GBQ62877.1 hypothetical protein AA0243_2982 [Novacetimonas hansenii NRIC 0243]GEC64151.1 N-6-adenine-methyltransferase [Novacetimonas hansenii]
MTKPYHAMTGRSDEWFTPPEIFEALGETFDLDVSQPETGREYLSVPCRRFLTMKNDGLSSAWDGFVWMNPPFGARNGVVPWLARFMRHGNGIACVYARTSAGWFHDCTPKADAMLFPRGKTKFIRPDGSRGNAPGDGIVLIGMGKRAVSALARAQKAGLGITVKIYRKDTV